MCIRDRAISVRDYGVGIDEDKVAHVFDRFWRSDPSRSRVTGGTGLGLAIAMTDALLHHGTIRVRSAVGEGTWFLVLLPRDPDQGEVADAELPVNFASETPDDLRITCLLYTSYEDVVMPHVYGTYPEDVWRARYDQINDFERELAASGCAILKLVLVVSQEEQLSLIHI